MPHHLRREPCLSRGGLRRNPVVADQPYATLQRCDLITLASLQILAARSKVAMVTGAGFLIELAARLCAMKTESTLVSTPLDCGRSCTALRPGQFLEKRRADVHHTPCTKGIARCDAESTEGPLVPALSAFVHGLTMGATEGHIQVGRARRGCYDRGKTCFPLLKTSLGPVATSVQNVSSYIGKALAEQSASCPSILDGREPTLADTPVGPDPRLPDRSVHEERRPPSAGAISGGSGDGVDGQVRDTSSTARAIRQAKGLSKSSDTS